MITILGGEILSALGEKEQRLKHLFEGSYKTVEKSMNLMGEELSFPYYSIDEGERNSALSIPLHYLEDAVQKAIDKCALTSEELSRCGLFVGSASNDLSLSLPLGKNYDNTQLNKVACERIGNGYYADHLTKHFGLHDFSLTYNTACTSSANALLDAASLLEGGIIDYALVIGFEMFAPISFEGFAAMQLLSPGKLVPFDRDRTGIVLGEAISALFLSRDDVVSSPWHFLGGVSSCETHSVTGANPNGEGISQVIKTALERTNITPDQICGVKAHGTASALNDLAEINGMKRVFSTSPDFFSLKPYIGHTLGSCGSSELLLMMECIDAGFLPGTPNFKNRDIELEWTPLIEKKSCTEGHFLLNYFGFGGNNTSLVIEKVSS
ncbi:MAG: beta-ketoacyl synthase N-terminal-like domain-containing protein [Helicobacteraceae bacterium]|jgi:3-oxoacyl-(acyl-carrier-protein) synthase|nr:beta-ketoacyl synthase N-terminal-like domain-containing protein [Helicobacteraceae bacterium]